MDLSWPIGGDSVNAGIPKDTYLGSPINLRYPTVDDLCKRAYMLSKHKTGTRKVVGWKKDMERAFKQIPHDPSCWMELGLSWGGAIFFDKTAVMGCRSAPYICQRTTNVIRHIMLTLSYIIHNYVDDFMSVDFEDRAWKSFHTMANLLHDLGVNEADDKAVQPTEVIEFLGVLYNLAEMYISLPSDKLYDLMAELKRWEKKRTMMKKQLQQVVGKLQFAASCVRAARVFTNRLIDAITVMDETGRYTITQEIRRDLSWWKLFLHEYNGKSIMWMEQRLVMDEVFATDSCLTGAGGFCSGSCFHTTFPEVVYSWQKCVHIAHFELLAILLAVRAWSRLIVGKKMVVGCDNQAVVAVVNTGRSRDQLLQRLLRELVYELAMADSEIYLVYVESKMNVLPDILSRMGTDKIYEQKFLQMKKPDWQETVITEDMFQLHSHW